MKLARKSIGKSYECNENWPDDCFVQCGDKGIVLSNNGNYFTAFFEAFPRNPDTFIRGEGKTIEEAEKKAFDEFTKISKCNHQEFTRKTYTNGGGFCVSCNMWKSNAFEPLTKCKICNIPTSYSSDKEGNYYCKEHFNLIPENLLFDYQKEIRGIFN